MTRTSEGYLTPEATPGAEHGAPGLPWALVSVGFWGTSSLVIVLVREVPAQSGASLEVGAAIGVGDVFEVGQYVDIDWNLLWPLAVIGAGVALIAVALRRRGA